MGPPETKRDTPAEGLGRAIAERQESNSFALLLEVGLLRFYPRALQQRGHNLPSPDSFLAPQGLAQGCRGKHQVEAHADAALAAGVGVDGVLQIRREDEQRAVLDLDHDLIGVDVGELRDGRPDNAGLAARVVEVDRVRAGEGAHVVHGAQVVVGVAVRAVRGSRRIQVRPAPRDLDRLIADFQELQHAGRRAADAVAELAQLLAPVQGMARLPGFAGLQLGQALPQCAQQPECARVDRFVHLGAKLGFPYQGRERRKDVRILDPRSLARYRHGAPARADPDYCASIPARFNTAAQRAISEAMNAPNSSGEPAAGIAPSLSRRARSSGVCMMRRISAFSFATMAPGVPAGATIPYQPDASNPFTPDWSSGGICGSDGRRVNPVTASARRRPEFTCGITAGAPLMPIESCPEMRSVSIGPTPL